jgi:hypothetical protein
VDFLEVKVILSMKILPAGIPAGKIQINMSLIGLKK